MMAFQDVELDPLIARVPGMTSAAERRFNTWFTSHAFEGRGEIVDLGCFVGSSTAALAAGLVRNPRGASSRIHAYDMFVMEEYMRSVLPDLSPGDTLLPVFQENVRPWLSRLDVQAGDVAALGWQGAPIEYLLVDLMKSWELAGAVARDFFPHLMPGKSLLVHQDYFHSYTGWIHILMYRLREVFRPELALPDRVGGTMVFRLVRSISRGECSRAADFRQLRLSEIHQAFAHSLAVSPTYRHLCLRATKAVLFWHLDQRQRQGLVALDFENPLRLAVRELVSLGPRLLADDDNLADALELIAADSWAAAFLQRSPNAPEISRSIRWRGGSQSHGLLQPIGVPEMIPPATRCDGADRHRLRGQD